MTVRSAFEIQTDLAAAMRRLERCRVPFGHQDGYLEEHLNSRVQELTEELGRAIGDTAEASKEDEPDDTPIISVSRPE